MERIIAELLKLLSSKELTSLGVIPWACPVPFFGKITDSKIATMGLNPSNLEFTKKDGQEYSLNERRLETLSSLRLEHWHPVDQEIITKVLVANQNYFDNRPYDFWFKKLDYLINGSSYSYYFPISNACHLDIVPFATSKKWNELSSSNKQKLIDSVGSFLGIILNNSGIHTLLLNGQAVVNELGKVSGEEFDFEVKFEWQTTSGDRKNLGKAYKGTIRRLGNIILKREIRILGFNHNIQSSYGITNEIQTSIRDWLRVELASNDL